ncbi:aldehyde dehydrogenase family protein [Paraburkholderia silviterrae]|uniref:Aldehyde dehydrogenase family protein n=1 Tax=Paraburkholderia silviterrae TaxID=2528715 RepID=A0A4R5M0X8_9BURK|nr:aldehyde dehydrogenase family protein [Paraburkholderia silviterrae]TDG18808.1 aldehyde dehydrogenase family protein [Paraburkholderia silviterrae]
MQAYFNLVGGLSASARDFYDVKNPATLDVVAQAPISTVDALDDAVAAANAAARGTWATDLPARKAMLAQCANRIESCSEELANILSLEQGKPLAAARGEIAIAVRLIRYYAQKDEDKETLRRRASGYVDVVRAPIGTVGLIVPWNYPITILMMKLAPALWAGNTVVIKPAPSTPLTTLKLCAQLADILPGGVVNTVTGGGEIGQALVEHAGIRKVSFTGSTPTGIRVMTSAAPMLKRLTLELGGNDAGIVCHDADVAAIAPRIFANAFTNAGQLCCAIKRLYVHRSIFDPMVEKLTEIASNWRVGPGLHPETQMGPLNNAAQRDHVRALLDDALAHGGTIHAGGDSLDGYAGYFLKPAIVSGVSDASRLVKEEQFGPALPVLPFDTVDEAIERANASEFGLGGSVWSSDVTAAAEAAARLEAVNLYVNQHAVPPDPELPFGGMKASGFGYELGEWGCDDFSIRKVLNVNMEVA